MSKDNDERAKRLAQALRENLRRRKAQHRGGLTGEPEPSNEPEAER